MTEKLQKHTLLLRAGDFEFLRERFPRSGASVVVRRAVSNLVDKLNQPVPPEDVAHLSTELEAAADE